MLEKSMVKMDGIDMTQDLPYLYIVHTVRVN